MTAVIKRRILCWPPNGLIKDLGARGLRRQGQKRGQKREQLGRPTRILEVARRPACGDGFKDRAEQAATAPRRGRQPILKFVHSNSTEIDCSLAMRQTASPISGATETTRILPQAFISSVGAMLSVTTSSSSWLFATLATAPSDKTP